MTEEEVFSFAGEFLRDCIYLQAVPKNPDDLAVAWWGGKLPDGTRHWISLKGSALLNPLPLTLQIVDGLRGIELRQLDEQYDFATLQNTKALYPHKEVSWPPVDVVLVNSDWISDEQKIAIKKWHYRQPEKTHFTRAYFDFWMELDPLHQANEPYAVLGGWHGQWPDNDWWDLIDDELLLWTLESAEPWLEVWKHVDEKIELIERVT